MKNINKKGISLIVLIITIIVVIILAAVVILTLSKNNPIESAKEAAFKEDIRTYQDELALAVSKQYTIDGGQRDEKISTSNFDEIKEYIPSFSLKYKNKFVIQDDELKYTKKLDDKEEEYVRSLNINKKKLDLPDEFQQVEYIESTGTQYIDTKYVPKINSDLSVIYKLPSWFNHNQSFTLLGSDVLSIDFLRFSGQLSTIFKKGENTVDISKWGFIYEDVYDMSIYGNEIKLINSQNTYNRTIDIDFTNNSSLSVFLFAKNTGNGVSNKINGRIYSFIIYENSVIVAKFIPALDINNIPCMYNTISREVFYNKGTGNFIAGPEVY